jgi:hypothetical protein
MLPDPLVPIAPRRHHLILEYVEAFRHERIADGPHALAIFAGKPAPGNRQVLAQYWTLASNCAYRVTRQGASEARRQPRRGRCDYRVFRGAYIRDTSLRRIKRGQRVLRLTRLERVYYRRREPARPTSLLLLDSARLFA